MHRMLPSYLPTSHKNLKWRHNYICMTPKCDYNVLLALNFSFFHKGPSNSYTHVTLAQEWMVVWIGRFLRNMQPGCTLSHILLFFIKWEQNQHGMIQKQGTQFRWAFYLMFQTFNFHIWWTHELMFKVQTNMIQKSTRNQILGNFQSLLDFNLDVQNHPSKNDMQILIDMGKYLDANCSIILCSSFFGMFLDNTHYAVVLMPWFKIIHVETIIKTTVKVHLDYLDFVLLKRHDILKNSGEDKLPQRLSLEAIYSNQVSMLRFTFSQITCFN